MSDMPEEIYGSRRRNGEFIAFQFYCSDETKYIRADLVATKDAEIAELKQALTGRTVSCGNCNAMAKTMPKPYTLFLHFALGIVIGFLLATIWPPVQHWPELETRLEIE